MKKLADLWHAWKGLDEDAQYSLEHATSYLDKESADHLRYLVKYRKAEFEDKPYPASTRLVANGHFPQLSARTDEKDTQDFIRHVNQTVREHVEQEAFLAFAKHSRAFLIEHLAPAILGMDDVKTAVVLQLCMPERFHILLLGDPGTGKTDILRAASEFAPISSFGLGSGSSRAGLAVASVGKEVHKGLLVQAHGGLCCIDELNLMQVGDRAALYNAMEKGFVSYDKGATHEKFPADVRLLATANPKGDQFRGRELATIRKQLPFEAALLSRFHLVFLIRKPDAKQFRRISEQVLQEKAKPLSSQDRDFVQRYLRFASTVDVKLPAPVESLIVDAATGFKKREKSLLTDVTPRLTKGLAALTAAAARIDLRTEASVTDAQLAIGIVERSFTIN